MAPALGFPRPETGAGGSLLSVVLVVAVLTSSSLAFVAAVPATAGASPAAQGSTASGTAPGTVPAVATTQVPHGGSIDWANRTVDGAKKSGSVGRFPDVALDGEGHPHVSYYDGGAQGNLKYAEWTGSAWQVRTVDKSGTVGGHTSIALDDNGNVHISYYDFGNGDLKYATDAGGGWSTRTVDGRNPTEDVGEFTSIAIDSNGQPHVSYYDRTNGNLKYARYNGVGWVTKTVDSGTDVGWYTSIALDDSDVVHVSYYDAGNGDLKYATDAGGSWTTATVDSKNDVGLDTSIALDGDGDPHVSYFEWTNEDLKYAALDGGAWQVRTVDQQGSTGIRPSLVLDDDGDPHVAYRDRSEADVQYVRLDGGTWTGGSIASNGPGTAYASLALDDHGTPVIAYYNADFQGLNVTEGRVAPTAPRSLSASEGDQQVSLSWNAPAYDGRAGVRAYGIYRDDGSGMTRIATTQQTSYVAGGTNGKQYDFVVRAINDAGTGPASSTVSATPQTTPGAPRALRAAAGDEQVSLSWTAPSTDGGSPVTEYRIYRDDGSGMTRVATVPAGTTTYTDTGLRNGREYTYEVRAVNANGRSPATNGASATPLGPPTAPRDVSASAGDGGVVVRWDAPKDDGGSSVTEYRVYRRSGEGSFGQVGTVSGTEFVDRDVDPGASYEYRVVAVTTVGQSGQSVTAGASIPEEETPTPTPTPVTPDDEGTPDGEDPSDDGETPGDGGTPENRETPGNEGTPTPPPEGSGGPPVLPVLLAVALLGAIGVGIIRQRR